MQVVFIRYSINFCRCPFRLLRLESISKLQVPEDDQKLRNHIATSCFPDSSSILMVCIHSLLFARMDTSFSKCIMEAIHIHLS